MISTRIQNHVEEYSSYFAINGSYPNWQRLEKSLVKEHEWTSEGAAALVQLARDYGSFILGHAYALSIALGIEDGELGY